MKIKNKRIYSADQQWLSALQKEYIEYGNFPTKLENGCLTIFAAKPKRKKRNRDR